ncbi:hypothetical protein JW968_05135 [Candidatus Woesearchaeota archaeon]|nr:hypothetical protein [Candidatus Woesearchaeota archaeon]
MEYAELHSKLEQINQVQNQILEHEKGKLQSIQTDEQRTKSMIEGSKLSQSLEKTKEQLINNARQAVNEGNTESLSMIFDLLIKLNNAVLGIVQKEKGFEAAKQANSKSNFSIEGLEIEDNKKSDKIYQGILEMVKQDPDLGRYIEEGRQNLEQINQLLAQEKGVLEDEIKQIAVALNELDQLEKNLKEQNRWLEKAFRKRFLGKTEFDPKANHNEITNNVSALFAQEVVENNNILRQIYAGTPRKEISQRIKWLEDKEMQIEGDINLLFKQFLIPKMEFPSGNYLTLTCSVPMAMDSIKNREIESRSTNTGTERFRVGSMQMDLRYFAFKLNTLQITSITQDNQTAFLFPLENVMRNSYFVHIPSLNELRVYLTPENDEQLIMQIRKDITLFDKIIKDIDDVSLEWFREAKKLNVDFKVEWNVEAKNIIRQDFTKRYINEQFDILRDKEHSLFDAIDFMTDEEWLSSISDAQKAEVLIGKYEPQKIKPRDFREQLLRLSKAEFIQAVIKAKQFYAKLLQDAVDFLKSRNTMQSTNSGIFVAPKSKVLFWEKFFERAGNRPNVFYYEGEDIASGISQCYSKCKSNATNRPIPKARSLYIYNCPSLMLQKL